MHPDHTLIQQYFPELTDLQIERFAALGELYAHWNAQINVVSRKDIDRLYEHHVLHSLGIAKVIQFHAGASILDIGTGGGFPGIPLAIMFPEAQFHLVDSIGKKIKVVNEVAAALELKNVKGEHARAEQLKSKYDYVVSRAVTALPKFLPWVKGKFRHPGKGTLESGLLYLKGGDFHEELNSLGLKRKPSITDLSKHFESDFFETKRVVYLPL